MAFFPRGPEGAHQIGNRTDEPARVLMWSDVTYPSATAYPDSDKVGVWTGWKPEDLIVERSSGVDYYKGESARLAAPLAQASVRIEGGASGSALPAPCTPPDTGNGPSWPRAADRWTVETGILDAAPERWTGWAPLYR